MNERTRAGITFAALLPVVMLLVNAIGLLTQVLLPHFLDPAEYSRFSTTISYGQFASVFFYEWLRLSVLRFSDGADAHITAARRKVMAGSLLGLTGLLIGISAAAFALHLVLGVPAWIAAVALYACCQGAFDSLQARRRAASRHKEFIAIWSSRSVLSLTLGLVVAAWTQSGLLTMLALALSYPVSLIADLWRMPAHWRTASLDRSELTFLMRFGVYMAAANALGMLFPALVRSLATLHLVDGSAGGIALAFDYLQKVVGLAGLAINILVAQRSFRSAEFDDAKGQMEQIRVQLFAPAFMIFTGTAAFILLLREFGSVLVPIAYTDSFYAMLWYSALASALIAVRMYSLDPLFVMSAKTRLAVAGPLATLIVTAAMVTLLVILGLNGIDAIGVAASAGAGAGLVVSYIVLRRSFPMPRIGGGVVLTATCVGTGMAAATALPTMWAWTDLLIRLSALTALGAIAPAVIFRKELVVAVAAAGAYLAPRFGRSEDGSWWN